MAPPGSVTSSRSTPNKPNKSKVSKPTSTKTVPLAPTNPDGTVRIHITPLTPAVFPTLLPRSLFDNTINYPPPVSYHTLEALPDKSYGYVDLSPQLASKLTTRINGTVFRGVKVSVQKARAQTWIPPPENSTELNNTHQSTIVEYETDQVGRLSEKKKRKKEDGVYPGIELLDGRWVKRAWTKVPITGTTRDKKDKNETRQQDMKKGSLLFKTTLPPTIPTPVITGPKALKKLEKKRKRAIAAAEAAAAESPSSDNGGSESEEGRKAKRKKAKKALKVTLPRNKTIIKEFTGNTKFPGFLKTSQLDPSNKRGKVTQFVEGVGWVDEEGKLVNDSAVKKLAEKRKNVFGAGSEVVEVELKKAANGNGQEMKEDVNSNDDDEEMEDAYVDSKSSLSGSESESKSGPAEAAEKAQPKRQSRPKGEVIGKAPEPVGNHKAGSSSTETSDPEPRTELVSKQSGINENAENKHEHVKEAALENSTPSIARKSHDSVEEFDTSSTSSSSEAESNSLGGSASGGEASNNDESSGDSDYGDESESESEEKKEEKRRGGLKTQVTPSAPSLKLSIPTGSTSEANKPHPLEALFKPTTDVSTTADVVTSSRGLFNFSFVDEDDDYEDASAETFEASNNRPYRSAAPTPDTAVVSKAIKWPDLARISSTSPINPRKLSFQHTPATAPGDFDAPLLFQGNAESAYLRGLSIWSGGHLPEAKSVTELPLDEEEEEAVPEAPKKQKRKGNVNEVAIGKHKERRIGQGRAVANRAETRKEIWKERFFKYRGEWNREWKNKKREAGKLARRKKRERGIGAGGSLAKQ